MAHKVIDRCKETTSTTGTGNLTLTGPVTGYVGVADATTGLTSNGDTSWFCAESGSQWEIFLGTRVSATELARSLISSSTGSTINFTNPPVVFSTVPGAKISSGGPAVSAYLATANQSITSATFTKVQLNTELFDVGSTFDATTNYRFTPNVEGYYQMLFSVNTIAASGATYMLSALYKNGIAACYGNYAPTVGQEGISTGAKLVYMNGTTDYLELFGLSNGTTVAFKFGEDRTFLTGHLARPA